jgi:hypothetical protein
MILSQMLKEEDNKYCVDCDTKSKDRNWAIEFYQSALFFRSSMD